MQQGDKYKDFEERLVDYIEDLLNQGWLPFTPPPGLAEYMATAALQVVYAVDDVERGHESGSQANDCG